jgi:hypothetical protein
MELLGECNSQFRRLDETRGTAAQQDVSIPFTGQEDTDESFDSMSGTKTWIIRTDTAQI